MSFNLKNKVALITGGASGIGLHYAKELLRKGAKGVTLADVNPQFGANALKGIQDEFGANKAIFVKTDVTNIHEFEDAFKKTLESFGNIDILFNNAGIMNDSVWEKEVAININGVINGMLLGMENYLQKHRQGSEAVIVNISSIAGISPVSVFPIYCGTKAAVLAMTRSWGTPQHYERTHIRVIGICPGVTDTPLISEMSGRNLGAGYQKILDATPVRTQEPEYLASEVLKLIENGNNGAMWVIERGQPAYEFIIPERRYEIYD